MMTGNGSLIWPDGVTSVEDCPNDLVAAFSHAVFILKTSENLMEDEHPPHWMWAFPEELDLHFERIKRKRNKGTKNDDETDDWAENEYAKSLR